MLLLCHLEYSDYGLGCVHLTQHHQSYVPMPCEPLSNYPYRPPQMYQSHGLSARDSNHNANKGKLSRMMRVMSHVLFLPLGPLGGKKMGGGENRHIQLLAQTALIVSFPCRVFKENHWEKEDSVYFKHNACRNDFCLTTHYNSKGFAI